MWSFNMLPRQCFRWVGGVGRGGLTPLTLTCPRTWCSLSSPYSSFNHAIDLTLPSSCNPWITQLYAVDVTVRHYLASSDGFLPNSVTTSRTHWHYLPSICLSVEIFLYEWKPWQKPDGWCLSLSLPFLIQDIICQGGKVENATTVQRRYVLVIERWLWSRLNAF
jgi:hypothetical protein